jgi:hypothetical protein
MDPNQPQPQAYQQNPGPQQAYAQPAQINKVVSSKGWYMTKIILGCFSLTTCVIIVGVGGALASIFRGELVIAVAFPPVCLGPPSLPG